ncbi:MAG: sn-glycerol-3-phosphate dehydrogenase subunit C [Chloroflexi bacterium RBG_16_52_11]|nr:MAG: sn-glycerol-3-phosphate dehydrogenase subunit C [Chloroflexi bacterium RBG_16_52_11]
MTQSSHLPIDLSLDQCIKCNICTSACPVAAVTDLFPGPKYVAPQAGRFRQPGVPTPDHSVDYCSGCRVCNMVCPTGVKIAEMNARARAVYVEQGKVPPIRRARNNLIARVELFGLFAQPIAPFSNWAINNPALRWLIERLFGIARHAYFPPLTRQRFTTWASKHATPPGTTRRVVLFHGCSTEFYEPRIGRAAVAVLEANGFEVLIPSQNCCGLPLLSNGEFPAAQRYHSSNVHHLIGYARQGIPIVGTSTSCTLTLKEEAPELLDMHDEDTRLVAEYVYDLNEFILLLLNQGSLNRALKPISLSLPYHAPCQYRAHRLGSPAVEVLGLIPELHIQESRAACCGIAGTYGYKEEKYEIAMQVGGALFDFVRQSNAPLAVCDSETCRWQITHGAGIPAVHPVELLAAAYGFSPEQPLASALAKNNVS